jgi:hypothetical protein
MHKAQTLGVAIPAGMPGSGAAARFFAKAPLIAS